MLNIEIKARYADLDHARNIAREINAKPEGAYEQVDTYFLVKRGRLKLREISSRASQLIFYERPDEAGPKTSNYQIYPVGSSRDIKMMLQSALGVWKVVEKQREVFWYDEVRIHLDQVTNVGSFIEFEGMLADSSKRSSVTEKVEFLINCFKIEKSDLIEASYSDLI
ncbi:MAG: class IV adenylate cyclase [bacterium]